MRQQAPASTCSRRKRVRAFQHFTLGRRDDRRGGRGPRAARSSGSSVAGVDRPTSNKSRPPRKPLEPGPLEGLRILDLTRLLPGGYATLLLADLGADVVKVEEPGKGDYIRWTPPIVGAFCASHIALNRNKRSITLNLKSDEGRDLFLKLAERFDVVIESFRPGVMERLGVGWSVLKDKEPAARLLRHLRIRTERSALTGRGARRELHRLRRRAGHHRRGRPPARDTRCSDRRSRGRGHGSGDRHPQCIDADDRRPVSVTSATSR